MGRVFLADLALMKSPRPFLRVLLLTGAIAVAASRTDAADSPELAEARARLLEYYQSGLTDSDNRVKQTKEKIAALEYVANARWSASMATQPSPKLISIDFRGGTMSALVDAINKDGGGFNVLGEKADFALELPAFSLRNAEATSLAQALSGLLQQRGYSLSTTGRASGNQSPVYTLRRLTAHEQHNYGASHIQSFQLGPYLEHQNVDDIVGAIRTAWELDPANKPEMLRVKYHPATNLLLVSGPPNAVNVVQVVLSQVRKSGDPAPKTKSGPTPPAADKR